MTNYSFFHEAGHTGFLFVLRFHSIIALLSRDTNTYAIPTDCLPTNLAKDAEARHIISERGAGQVPNEALTSCDRRDDHSTGVRREGTFCSCSMLDRITSSSSRDNIKRQFWGICALYNTLYIPKPIRLLYPNDMPG